MVTASWIASPRILALSEPLASASRPTRCTNGSRASSSAIRIAARAARAAATASALASVARCCCHNGTPAAMAVRTAPETISTIRSAPCAGPATRPTTQAKVAAATVTGTSHRHCPIAQSTGRRWPVGGVAERGGSMSPSAVGGLPCVTTYPGCAQRPKPRCNSLVAAPARHFPANAASAGCVFGSAVGTLRGRWRGPVKKLRWLSVACRRSSPRPYRRPGPRSQSRRRLPRSPRMTSSPAGTSRTGGRTPTVRGRDPQTHAR